MTQKKFERDSKFASDWDLDGDGLVSDAEVESSKQIKQTETELRRHLAQLRMARFTLAAMGAFTLAMFFIPLERVEALADISNLFYISGAGIVGAYMGFTTLGGKKGANVSRSFSIHSWQWRRHQEGHGPDR